MRCIFRSLLLAAALPLATASATHAAVCHPSHVRSHRVHRIAVHQEGGLGVVIDQARLISFPKPVKTVFVGNPTIVDVSMVDPQHAFLLGKTFGVTNMIALGSDGTQISDQQVVVLNNGTAVTINRGTDQFDYMCTPAHCETAPRPGDPQTYVTNTEAMAATHEGAASAGTASAPSVSMPAQQ